MTRRRLPLDASPLTVRLPSVHVQAIRDLADRYDQDPAWAHRLAVAEGLKVLVARGLITPFEDEGSLRIPASPPPTAYPTDDAVLLKVSEGQPTPKKKGRVASGARGGRRE